jgi:creatinine amidohydrolase
MYPASKLPPIKAMSMREEREIEEMIKGPLNGGKHIYTLGYLT